MGLPRFNEVSYDDLSSSYLDSHRYLIFENLDGDRESIDIGDDTFDTFCKDDNYYVHDLSKFQGSSVVHLAAHVRYSLLCGFVNLIQSNVKILKAIEMSSADKVNLKRKYRNGLIIKDKYSQYLEDNLVWIRARKRMAFPAFVSGINNKFIEFSVIDEDGDPVLIAEVKHEKEEHLLEYSESYFGKVYEITPTKKSFDNYVYKAEVVREMKNMAFYDCILKPRYKDVKS